MNTLEKNVAANLQLPGFENQFSFFLYVKGASPNSLRAITNFKDILEVHLNGNYTLKVIDVHQHYVNTENVILIALPLVVRMLPFPQRRCTGAMSDVQKVITALGLNDHL